MAKSTLPSSAENGIAFPQAALACGLKVGIGLIATVSVLALLGTIIDHYQTLLWLVAIGGQLWGSIAVGTLAIVVMAWACCLEFHLREHDALKARAIMIATGVLGTVLWLVSTLAMYSTFDNFGALNIYAQIAVVMLHGPYMPLGFMVFCWVISLG